MWAIGVIAAAIAATAFVHYLRVRSRVAPMERHLRALEALRDLSEHPQPTPDLVIQPESSTDHVRILQESPTGFRKRAASRRAGTGAARPANPSRRTTGTRSVPGTKSSRARTRAPASTVELPVVLIRPISDWHPLPHEALDPAEPLPPAPTGSGPRRVQPAVADRMVARADRARAQLRSVPTQAYVAASALTVVVLAIVVVTTVGTGGHGPARVATAPVRSSGSTPPSSFAPTTTTPPTTNPASATPLVARTSDGASVTVRSPFRLTLQASGTCWVEVTDATGKSLFTATMRAGQSQDIPDAQTVVVRLGYTPAMTLSVDGVAIDLGQLAQTANVDFRTT